MPEDIYLYDEQLPRHQALATLGSSGVGKTTLYSPILRFYDADAGQVLFDGRDVRNIRLRPLTRNA